MILTQASKTITIYLFLRQNNIIGIHTALHIDINDKWQLKIIYLINFFFDLWTCFIYLMTSIIITAEISTFTAYHVEPLPYTRYTCVFRYARITNVVLFIEGFALRRERVEKGVIKRFQLRIIKRFSFPRISREWHFVIKVFKGAVLLIPSPTIRTVQPLVLNKVDSTWKANWA